MTRFFIGLIVVLIVVTTGLFVAATLASSLGASDKLTICGFVAGAVTIITTAGFLAWRDS